MFNGNYPSLPYIVEGEIIEVHDYPSDTAKKTRQLRYVCKVSLQNGSDIILPNVIESTKFGGIADYVQIRHKTSKDDLSSGAGGALASAVSAVKSFITGSGPYVYSNQDGKNNARVGDRVYISFINGIITRPIIIGSAQHPNQTDEFGGEIGSDVKPQAIFQYNGVRITVDEEGQLSIIHKGLPAIKVEPGAGAKSSAGSLIPLLGASEPENDAVVFPNQDDERTIIELLKEGIFRVRDSDGQIIEIDKNKKRIFISNADIKSTDSLDGLNLGAALAAITGGATAESILLDKDGKAITTTARSLLKNVSLGDAENQTAKKHSHTIGGDSEWGILGSENKTIGGSHDAKVSGSWNVIAVGGVKMGDGVGAVVVDKGKVALGNPTIEILDALSQTLDQFIQNAPTLVSTVVGPGVLNPAIVLQFTALKTLIDAAKASV